MTSKHVNETLQLLGGQIFCQPIMYTLKPPPLATEPNNFLQAEIPLKKFTA